MSEKNLKTSTGLSVVYITLNEERNLSRSLESVSCVADEIIVVDSGSTDSTCSIAKKSGADVFLKPWQGFGAQRQYAVSLAKHDWILILDADETLAEGSTSPLLEALSKPEKPTGYFLARETFIGQKPILHGDWANESVLRLVNRRHGHYDPRETIHESWHCSGATAKLKGVTLKHYSFANQGEMLNKLLRYTQLNAQKVAARGRPISSWTPMSHALWAFFRCYLLRLGFLDGVEGGAIAWTTALGAYFKYALAREMLTARQRDSS